MKQEALWISDKGWIKDSFGRIRILRGVSVSAASRTTGRPFPEEEADAHFMRLSQAGCTFLRWQLPWSAVEPTGPEEYDENYLAYLRNLLKKAEEYNISVFIEPFQSSFTQMDGDGIPDWALEKIGFNKAALRSCGAAVTEDDGGWKLNMQRYACQTLSTLFFAGGKAAPSFKIEGDSAQYFLQSHFIAAMNHTARRIKDCPAVAGFAFMNAPSAGYIGMKSLAGYETPLCEEGIMCTPFEGMKAASGYPAEFRRFVTKEKHGACIVKEGRAVPVNAAAAGTSTAGMPGAGVFLPGFSDPWKAEGIWTDEGGVPVLKKADYFAAFNFADCWNDFQVFFMEELQKKHGHYLFLSPVPVSDEHIIQTADWSAPRPIAPSDFDGFASTAVQQSRKAGIPLVVQGFSTLFNVKNGKAFRTGDYSLQVKEISGFYDTLDKYMLSGFLDSYTPTNTQESGDGWNGGDTSVWCMTDRKFRAEKGFIRPYVIAVAGIPVRMTFYPAGTGAFNKGPVFEFEWDSTECSPSSGESDTEIFVPKVWFPKGWKVEKFDGAGALRDDEVAQRLFVKTLAARRCFLRIISK